LTEQLQCSKQKRFGDSPDSCGNNYDMWALVLVTLVNGGTAPPRVQEIYFQTKQQCMQAKRSKEVPEVTFGYCQPIKCIPCKRWCWPSPCFVR
jgi:hypothetical protein